MGSGSFRLHQALALGVGGLGGAATLQWFTAADRAHALWPSLYGMGLNAPLLLMAAGFCCWHTLSQDDKRSPLMVAALLAASSLLVCLPLLILAQHIFSLDLGIDFHRSDLHPTAENPHPGRIAPNTCVALAVAGLALFLVRWRLNAATLRWYTTATTITALFGLTGLAGHVLGIEALYRVAALNRMLLPTAIGISLLAFAMWAMRDEMAKSDLTSPDEQERSITVRSIIVMTLAVTAAGIAGFGLLRDSFEKSAFHDLQLLAKANATAMGAELRSALWYPRAAASRPSVIETLDALDRNPLDAKALAFMDKLSASFLTAGIDQVVFTDSAGRLAGRAGRALGKPEGRLHTLPGEAQSYELLYLDGYVLRTQNPVTINGRQIGTVTTTQRLPLFDQLVTEIRQEGESADATICSFDGPIAACGPSGFEATASRITLEKDAAKGIRSALSLARKGASGLVRSKTNAGVSLAVAYAPIGARPLTLIVATNSEVFYAPLRERLNLLVIFLASLVAVGTWALRSRVRPLVGRIVAEQKRVHDILAHCNDGFIGIDQCGLITDWNAEAERIFGWTADEVIGRPIEELIIPADQRAAHAAGFKRFALRGEGPIINRRVELVALHRDGHDLAIELSVAAVQTVQGFTATAFVRDISERKAVSAKLAASEARLKGITDNLPALIAYVDRTQTYRFANAYFKQAMGTDPKDVLGQTMQQFLGADAHTALRPHIEGALRGEHRKFERTGWARNADIHFLVEYLPDVDAEGLVIGFYIMVLDITERRRAENALARSEQSLRSITDNLPAMISHFDRDLRYTFANAKVGEVFGRDPASLLGQSIREARGEKVFADVAPKMALALAGQAVTFEASAVTNGRQEHFEANYIPDFDPAGQVRGFFALTFEVTQRKESENRLRASLQLLDRTGRMAGVGGWELELATGQLSWTEQTRLIHEVGEDFVPTLDNAVGFYVGDARDAIQRVVEVALSEGTTWDIELPLRTAKGRSVWVRTTGEVERVEGKPVRLFGAIQDVSQRVASERQLREQAGLLQVTLKSIGDGVITTDEQGRIRWMNPVAERMTGWGSDSAQGKLLPQVFNVVHADTRMPAPDPIALCLKNLEMAGLPSRSVLISHSGEEFAVEDSACPIRDDDGGILGAVLVFHDVSEQRRMTDQMTYRATHDELTGLINRADFESRLERVLTRMREESRVSVLMFIDLDQFKLVNDACGHAMGDKLLCQVSALMSKCVRSRDTLARLGGDEFGVILEHCSIEQAQRVAQTICDQMDEFRFIHDGRRFRIGTSIGLAPIDARWHSREALQQAADTACYAAKEAGRNRAHVWFDTDKAMKAREGETQWVSRLEAALDEDQFLLYAQIIEPMHSAAKGLHFEVLLRLRDVDGAIIAPGVFLPAAERFHMASRIDRWVVRKVFEWLASEGGSPQDIDTVSVNLSGQSIGDRAFHRYLLQLLKEISIDPRKLCFEVTETAAITNLADATSFIDSIRLAGMRVSLDDFGAGASSFGYLKSLPVDYLKIDGQFVQNIQNDPLDKAAVRCFHEVARAIGVQTIAEFVESGEILETLREIGIDFAQGYLFHRPEPLEKLLLRKRAVAIV